MRNTARAPVVEVACFRSTRANSRCRDLVRVLMKLLIMLAISRSVIGISRRILGMSLSSPSNNDFTLELLEDDCKGVCVCVCVCDKLCCISDMFRYCCDVI